MPAVPDPRTASERQARARRNRNVALGVALGALCLLFYAVTIVKFGPSVLGRPL